MSRRLAPGALLLKFDGLRSARPWTVVGYFGRIRDFDTLEEAAAHLGGARFHAYVTLPGSGSSVWEAPIHVDPDPWACSVWTDAVPSSPSCAWQPGPFVAVTAQRIGLDDCEPARGWALCAGSSAWVEWAEENVTVCAPSLTVPWPWSDWLHMAMLHSLWALGFRWGNWPTCRPWTWTLPSSPSCTAPSDEQIGPGPVGDCPELPRSWGFLDFDSPPHHCGGVCTRWGWANSCDLFVDGFDNALVELEQGDR